MSTDPPYRGGCVKGMPMPRDDRPSCHRGCLHRQMVLDYRDSRHAWEEQRENGDNMRLEDDEYRVQYPPPTFKKWLVGLAGRHRQET